MGFIVEEFELNQGRDERRRKRTELLLEWCNLRMSTLKRIGPHDIVARAMLNHVISELEKIKEGNE